MQASHPFLIDSIRFSAKEETVICYTDKNEFNGEREKEEMIQLQITLT